MGLDMYACTLLERPASEVDFVEPDDAVVLHYWRKHPNLHGWMEQLYRKKGGSDEHFNCVTLLLTEADIAELEADIRAGNLPTPELSEPEDTDSGATTEKHEPQPEPSRAGVISQTRTANAANDNPRLPRTAIRALVATIAVLLGIYGWVQSRNTGRTPSPETEPTAQTTPPKPPPAPEVKIGQQVTPEPTSEQPKPPTRSEPAPQITTPRPAPEQQPAEVVPPSPPSEEEKRLAEQRRIEQALIASRQEAFDLEQRRLDDEALRHDANPQDDREEQLQRDQEARDVAGAGYRLQENASISEASYKYLQTENVTDCALACLRENCDAFVFNRDQYGPGSRRARYCTFYRKPFTKRNQPGFVLGERLPETPSGQIPAKNGAAVPERPVMLAQAGNGIVSTDNPDGITRCANGPVKVSGFKLTCDQLAEGGVVRGVDVVYMLSNINQCAAKCSGAAQCAGFAFNAGEPNGQHRCLIFATPVVTREVKGWISGVR